VPFDTTTITDVMYSVHLVSALLEKEAIEHFL